MSVSSYETHRVIVDRYLGGGPCEIEVGRWPYECEAKDRGDRVPVVCVQHLAWWTAPPIPVFPLHMRRCNGSVWEFDSVDTADDPVTTHFAFPVDWMKVNEEEK